MYTSENQGYMCKLHVWLGKHFARNKFWGLKDYFTAFIIFSCGIPKKQLP